jgi:hypothetical protein
MFNAVWKTLRAAPFVKFFHKARIVLPEHKCENEIESESDSRMVQNRPQLCKTVGIMFRQHMMTLLVL